MISIKNVSKQTGVSVRTLRYYDEIDLLSPAGKTDGGHRLYGETELKKLQQILFLKTLGFQLKEIKDILSDDGNWNWAKGLENQLKYIQQEKERMIKIEQTLKGLMNSLTIDGSIDLLYINQLIQLYQQNAEKREIYRHRYFDSQERELLHLLPNMNRDDPDSIEWISLIAQLKKHMGQGIKAPEVQRVVKRIDEKSIETFGYNDAFFEKFWAIRKSPEKSKEIGLYPIEQELLDFFEQAWEVYQNEQFDGEKEG